MRRSKAADRLDDGPTRLRVRPYLLTGGRTRSDVDLAVETLLQTTEHGTSARSEVTLERADIVELCADPISLTELSARLGLPLQVTRVLVGDLVNDGFVEVHHATANVSDRPDLNLLERVLDGLQNL